MVLRCDGSSGIFQWLCGWDFLFDAICGCSSTTAVVSQRQTGIGSPFVVALPYLQVPLLTEIPMPTLQYPPGPALAAGG